MMNVKGFLGAALATILALGGGAAAAHGYRHHGHVDFGFYFGAPLFWGPYPYYYPYYAPPVYVERAPIYIERVPQTYIQQSSGYWYYCREPSGYYPYVQTCPSGWLQVVPQAQPPQQ